MAEPSHARGVLDTSVLAHPNPDAPRPRESCISALSLAELAAGPHAAEDAAERARRQHRLQTIETTVETLPFDARCARAYGRVFAAVSGIGRKPRGRRAVDLMIAATALAHDLPLYTRNARDLDGLDELLEVVDAGSPAR